MTDDFLDLLAIDPSAGRQKAAEVIAASSDNVKLAFAYRAMAVYCREFGDAEGAMSNLRRAVRHARDCGEAEVLADVRATRGVTLVIFGRSRRGLSELEAASRSTSGVLRATIEYRLGTCYLVLGDPIKASRRAEAALNRLKRHPGNPWLPNALTLLGECEVRLGRLESAAEHYAAAKALIGDQSGHESLRLQVMEGRLAFLRGDIPKALAIFSAVDLKAIEDGHLRARITTDFGEIYISAGLFDEAVHTLESFDPDVAPTMVAAEWRGMLARALLHAGQEAESCRLAEESAAVLESMGFMLESAEAGLTALIARASLGQAVDEDISRKARRLAEDLSASGSRLAADGWLLAGRSSAAAGSNDRATSSYAQGAVYRHHTDLLTAASGWLAQARWLESVGAAGTTRACSRGLDAVDGFRDIMGSSEVRAATTHRGRELAELAVRHAAHDPRSLLYWSERWRATSVTHRPVTPHGEVSPEVAMLRDSGRLIAEARAAGESTEALERERRALERKVRSQHHQQRTIGAASIGRFRAAHLLAEVRDGAFIELVDVDGTLHVLVVSKGRVRRAIAGETKAALDLAEAGRFALRRAARTNRFAPGDLGQRFQDTVLGKAVRMLPDGPVTISPTAALHGAPFALMPALGDRPFSIVPSAAQWLRAKKVEPPREKSRALIAGPNLLTGGSEVARLAKRYPDATVLTDKAATVEATMAAIDGAHLAHLATHGTFRADSPLFSALEMADGPLSVYELERLKRAPYRTILSACDSGVLAPVGAQEVLGLASALFSLGSAGLLCSIAEVNDEVTADLMMEVHAELDAGRSPAEALAKVRSEADPIKLATAAAFVALGV